MRSGFFLVEILIRMSLQEFAFVTGLKCGRIPICLKRKVARYVFDLVFLGKDSNT